MINAAPYRPLCALRIAWRPLRLKNLPNNQGVLAGQTLKRDSLLADSTKSVKRETSVTGRDGLSIDNIKLYPNPANQKVTIKIPDIENNYSLTILNNSSQVLMTGIALNEKLNDIDISKLSKGVYQVVVTGRCKIIHFKLAVE